MAELISKFEADIKSITLIPSDGGRFEVTANLKTVYSKLATGRHANPGEVAAVIQKIVEEG